MPKLARTRNVITGKIISIMCGGLNMPVVRGHAYSNITTVHITKQRIWLYAKKSNNLIHPTLNRAGDKDIRFLGGELWSVKIASIENLIIMLMVLHVLFINAGIQKPLKFGLNLMVRSVLPRSKTNKPMQRTGISMAGLRILKDVYVIYACRVPAADRNDGRIFMNERQFALQQEMLEMILNKLEEIRCCIIDVEEAIQESSHQADPADPCNTGDPKNLRPPSGR